MANPFNQEKADAFLALAISKLGVHEEPMGSNSGPEVNEWLAFVGLGPGYAWCAAFAYSVLYYSGVNPHGPRTGSTGHGAAFWKALDAQVTGDDIREGDIGCLRGNTATGYEHTFIVRHNFGGGRVESIDGNWGDRVAETSHAIDMCDFFRPY